MVSKEQNCCSAFEASLPRVNLQSKSQLKNFSFFHWLGLFVNTSCILDTALVNLQTCILCWGNGRFNNSCIPFLLDILMNKFLAKTLVSCQNFFEGNVRFNNSCLKKYLDFFRFWLDILMNKFLAKNLGNHMFIVHVPPVYTWIGSVWSWAC